MSMAPVQLGAAMTGICTGLAVCLVTAKRLHLPRPPAGRFGFYLGSATSYLGGPSVIPTSPPFLEEALRRILGPLVWSAGSSVARALGVTVGDDLELLLRQAGLDLTPDAYRREHLRWAVLTPVGLGALALVSGRADLVIVCFLAGVVAGARRAPEKLRAQIRRRCERLRSDLPTVMPVLALKVENNKSLTVAVADVVAQGSGPVVSDLKRALSLMNAGYRDVTAYELLAIESAEQAASRFYRLLSAAAGGGIDLATALLAQANEIRTQRREEVERTAARRQMALIVPNLLFMAPVLFVFLLAPLPRLLFGG